jgi:hypothetical protein
MDLRVDGRLNMLGMHSIAVGPPGPVVGLAYEIGDVAQARAELLGITEKSRALLDGARDCARRQRQELFTLGERGNEPTVKLDIIICAVEPVLEISRDLEELLKVGVELAE